MLPETITSIEHDAFRDCTGLMSIDCKPQNPPSMETRVFDNNAPERKIYVPISSVETYMSAPEWSNYSSTIIGYNY